MVSITNWSIKIQEHKILDIEYNHNFISFGKDACLEIELVVFRLRFRYNFNF